tara:strand:+ start:58 stop:324 length:267 start_codon:yes stop_codon:yes gene_type:complete
MNEKIFKAIFNLLAAIGDTALSQSKKSIVCFTYMDDTSAVDALLPASWNCKANKAQFLPDGTQKSPAMTIVFNRVTQTADDAFADFIG